MPRPNMSEEDLKAMKDRMKVKEHGGVVGTRTKVGKNIVQVKPPGPAGSIAGLENKDRLDKAGSNPAHAPTTRPSPYKSKWESAYAHKLQLELLAGEISGWWYEPFSLWLPGQVRYKPDFLVQYPSGELYLLEVKGWSKNLRDGMTRLKIAASIFYCFKWCLVHRLKGGGWAHDVVGTKEGS